MIEQSANTNAAGFTLTPQPRTGWICGRCSASNSPDVQRCVCTPVAAPVYPYVPYVPSCPSYPWWTATNAVDSLAGFTFGTTTSAQIPSCWPAGGVADSASTASISVTTNGVTTTVLQ